MQTISPSNWKESAVRGSAAVTINGYRPGGVFSVGAVPFVRVQMAPNVVATCLCKAGPLESLRQLGLGLAQCRLRLRKFSQRSPDVHCVG